MECGSDCGCGHEGEGISRREVLGAMAVAAVAVPVLGSVAHAEGSSAPATAGWIKTVKPSELQDKTARAIKGAENKSLAILVREGDVVTALSARCTHKGCGVNAPTPHGPLVCPCHHAEFDLTGKNLRGPGRGSPKPDLASLSHFALRLNPEGIIEIHVGATVPADAKDASLKVA